MIHALALSLCVAQPPVDALRGDLKHYFAGESSEAWAFTGLGVGSLGVGAGLFAEGSPRMQGAAVPLFAVGLLQLVLGVGLWIRTPPQVAALDAQLTSNPADVVRAERARMSRVMRGFGLYKATEVALFFGGVGLAGVGGVTRTDFALGAGLSLAAEALVMLLLDFYAEARGHAYEGALLRF